MANTISAKESEHAHVLIRGGLRLVPSLYAATGSRDLSVIRKGRKRENYHILREQGGEGHYLSLIHI